ncbi:MAG: sulfatase-like hydrolase/transferase [Acidobacteria bacterium]|nr:sulfatase-like hydrolase/transferase [Acidobacteriota bacterium]
MRHATEIAVLAAWRRRYPHAFRVGFWYLLGAVSLTVLWPAAVALAPDAGLTRSYWYPDDALTEPVVAQRITAVDLAFIAEQGQPTRNYRVRWEGVWFSPRAERVDFLAGADDGVILLVDGETVLERSPAGGMHTEARTVELEAGPHRLEIEHWQAGGGRSLNVQWAPFGSDAELLSPTRLFPADPGPLGYWLRYAATRLPGLLMLIWAAGPALLFALAVWQTLYLRVTTLGRGEAWRRLRTVLLPAALGPGQLLLFGPWTVHDTNRAEFLLGFWTLASGWVWLLAPIVGALAALSLLLPLRWFPRYVAALCAVGVLLWAQGNLLLADYGVLDGGGLDLASHAWRTPLEAGLWVSVLAFAVAFAGVVARAAPVASGMLVALQTVVLLVPASGEATAPRITNSSSDRAETGWQLPPPEVFELSSTRNLIYIVLDSFPSHTFAEILDADRSAFERDWRGFTFFANHLGTRHTTRHSIPAMLTGIPFGFETFSEYLARHPSVFNVLGQQGWRLRLLLSTHHGGIHVNPAFPGVDRVTRYDIPNPYGSYGDYVDFTAAQLLDLSLLRHAPHAFKPGVYRGDEWLFQEWLASRLGPEATAERPFGDAVFLQEFASRITRGDVAPVHMFMHLLTPHPPIVTDSDCRYAPKRPEKPEDFRSQAECTLSGVEALLRRLRDLDLYDQSAIVVTSDHGVNVRLNPLDVDHPFHSEWSPTDVTLATVQRRAAPLLLVKPFAAEDPLQVSHAPTSALDLPATLLDLADLPVTLGNGASVLGLDPATPRPRTYAHGSGSFDGLHLFTVNGHINDPDAWSSYRSVFAPALDRAVQRRAHRIGLFADPIDTTSQSRERIYRTDERAVFYAAPEDWRVTFDVRRIPAMATAQTVTIRIDGDIVDQRRLVDDAWHTLSYPVTARSAENIPFRIELLASPAHVDADGESYGLLLRGDI